MEKIVDVNEDFEKLILHTPKAIQGGNAYIANISLHDAPVIFQTPKCKCKKGVHKTNKQIYTDLLFTDHDYTFLNWIQNLEKKVQKLIYGKRETWFGGDEDDELTLDDIEHNWMSIIKSYKKKYLVRTYFPKNIKTYSRAVSVYDNEENELSIDAIVGDSNLITILQLGGLKFSPTYFHLELNVRQVMVIKEKELFKVNPKNQPDLDNYTYLIERQLKPEARKDIRSLLKELNVKPTAMIDISDGLSSEIMHICSQSNVGCKIYEDKIPLDPQVISACEEFDLDSTMVALSGGEDYELLFTVYVTDYEKIKGNPHFSVIGHVTEKALGLHLVTRANQELELKAQGWNALRKE